ncbi:DUF922 domain-containing Zn-dependent protease [Vibrio aestuarianus]|uniref:DUF922 domain-containing protein n=1 Tax=Vibrio aestuarianus TaxID=28171 RepID=UPI00237CDF0C|nr:DUF922 domain-containing protein [Vibrio aestuarianus]MDE1348790.1 DUF922 domain-containing Zn-dependent protease [Vibrio aestuarianus]
MFNSQFIKITLFYTLVSGSIHAGTVQSIYPFDKSYDIYTVTGNSIEQIDASFELSMPSWLYNQGFDAYTRYKYDFLIDDETCSIERFSFKVNYTLPQLVLNEDTTYLKHEYKTYLQNLYRHEEIHCAISMEIVDKMYKAAQGGQNNPRSCTAKLAQIQMLEEELIEINKSFDRDTNHGEFPHKSLLGRQEYINKCQITPAPIKLQSN